MATTADAGYAPHGQQAADAAINHKCTGGCIGMRSPHGGAVVTATISFGGPTLFEER